MKPVPKQGSASSFGLLSGLKQRRRAQSIARFEPFALKPALIHLEGKPNGFFGAMARLVKGLHIGDVDDSSVIRNERDRQGQGSVFHPEAVSFRDVEYKDHAAIAWQ